MDQRAGGVGVWAGGSGLLEGAGGGAESGAPAGGGRVHRGEATA